MLVYGEFKPFLSPFKKEAYATPYSKSRIRTTPWRNFLIKFASKSNFTYLILKIWMLVLFFFPSSDELVDDTLAQNMKATD